MYEIINNNIEIIVLSVIIIVFVFYFLYVFGTNMGFEDLLEKENKKKLERFEKDDTIEETVELMVYKVIDGERVRTDEFMTFTKSVYNNIINSGNSNYYYMEGNYVFTPSFIDMLIIESIQLEKNTKAIEENTKAIKEKIKILRKNK